MSTDFNAEKKIYVTDLFDGRLLEFGIEEHFPSCEDEERRCLTDGTNFVWVWCDEKGFGSFSRYMGSNGEYILDTISEVFKTKIYSEYQPEYWGFKTEAEERAALEAWGLECERIQREEYDQIVQYILGGSHGIEPGTCAAVKAELAKQLISETPGLLDDNRRAELVKAVERAYTRHRVETGEIPF